MSTTRDLLARTLWAEAGNQGLLGMIAAGAVIANRRESDRYGNDWESVIMAPGQFSAWNSVTGYANGEQGQNMVFTPPPEAYQAADTIIGGAYDDPTGGALNYFNPDISQPAWGQQGEWTRIGDHVFGTAYAGAKPQPRQAQEQEQPDTFAEGLLAAIEELNKPKDWRTKMGQGLMGYAMAAPQPLQMAPMRAQPYVPQRRDNPYLGLLAQIG